MDQKKAVEEAFSELAPRYEQVVDSELRLIWGWTYKGFVDQLIELSTVKKDDLVLDIATGTGVIPLRLTELYPNENQFIGLDITPQMLQHARRSIAERQREHKIRLTCASAMDIPFGRDTFNLITCGLATHHMNVPRLISEIFRVLAPGGRITIVDVGAAPIWKFPPFKVFLHLVALGYFLPKEGWARAWAETTAVANMYTMQEWENALRIAGFTGIHLHEMKSKHFWAPSPLAMQAMKPLQAEGTLSVQSD
jgi:ubiquinone/menaquinone biosynthesis C-methylase UbiE